ncbi:MAG: hypothetical protein Q8P31_01685, partial [Bacillota bacterium]|nr:hypothetical protein [Bacillota bacterium]
TLSAVPSVLIFALVLRVPVLYLLVPAAAGLLGSLAAMTVGLGVDIRRPMLRCKDPAEPAKRNLTALVPMGLGVGAVAASVPVARIMLNANWGIWLVHTLFLAGAGGLALAAVRNLMAQAEGLFGRLEI